MILLLVFSSCQLGKEIAGGTEIPNELVGREVIAGKGPAVDAEIRIIPVGYQPGGAGDKSQLPNYSLRTDSSGRFKLIGALPGQYNILAVKGGLKSFRDSVAITEISHDLGTDTLLLPGSLFGKVVLEPDHDPRSAIVQVLGTNLYVNVDSAGSFALPDLAQGKYRLQVETSLPGYTTLYTPAEVRSGRSDTLPELKPFYAYVPVVTGLSASTNPDGHIFLRWDPSPYLNIDSYLIYRDSATALLPSASPIARVEETSFTDTLFSGNPKSGQYPLTDSTIREFTYRVRLLTRGGDIGPAYAKATALTYSKGRVVVSAAWRRMTKSADFSNRAGSAVIEFKNRIWIVGGMFKPGVYHQDVWSSEDGYSWTKELQAFPGGTFGLYQAAVFQENLWVLALERQNNAWYPVCYSSPDGREWTRIGGMDMPFGQVTFKDNEVLRSRFSFVAFADRLWMVGGSAEGGVYSSPDGMTWSHVEMPENGDMGVNPGTVIVSGSLWIMGGGDMTATAYPPLIWKTSDGDSWTSAVDSSGFLPRIGMSLVSRGWECFGIGGYRPRTGEGGGWEAQDLNDEVWRSDKFWHLFDAHAPFGRRLSPGVGTFRGKVWVIGGLSSSNDQTLGDIWVMDWP